MNKNTNVFPWEHIEMIIIIGTWKLMEKVASTWRNFRDHENGFNFWNSLLIEIITNIYIK